MKKNIGSALTLYPTPVVVVGTMMEKKPNWMLVAHIGITWKRSWLLYFILLWK